MTRFLRLHLCALLALLLASCATTKNVTDGSPLRPNQGLLAFKATTYLPVAQLQYRKFSTNSSLGYFLAQEFTGPSGAFVNTAGEKYWVTPVNAGEYMWSEMNVGNRFAVFHGSNRFTIKPGTITYIGHLVIEEVSGKARIGVGDQELDMQDFLDKNYPQYVRTMPIVKSISAFDY